MGTVVMHVVEVKRNLKIFIRWAREKVQTTVFSQQCIGHFHHRRDGGVNENVIETRIFR